MQSFNFQYIPGSSFLHRMDGRTKLALLACWVVSIFLFYDIRILAVFLLGGFLLIPLAQISFWRIRRMILMMIGFVTLTAVLTNILTPSYAGRFVAVQHPLFTVAGLTITKETAFYSVMLIVKYLAIFPMAILFILTTHPSRLASSLHRIGVPYKIAYSLNIALRYLPNVQREFMQIAHAQQARGVSLEKGSGSIGKRMRAWVALLMPLFVSSLDRVETVSNAMELRGFGNRRSRSWYNATSFTRLDTFTLTASVGLVVCSIFLKLYVFESFWYPFGP
ncbi:energy-coupling factor transporter transmembrane protein EcfT [Brevibacillus humidisoli]|uniref:energy-coupling factor transporter transmembrane component T family protein n=1 Tax=Brevibacillus humidisoli TaxID=2895522 RepID=UPI001E4BC79A|nr:energy-coupling factor transporter transmembrane component T [Brevibacillus humidisoli]UFJ39487.1 energy-coupling factor transporter transmembrane protein EcfT [Brevibacillus humidisoli]